MGESQHKRATSSRLGTRNTGGEIVEVQGGHILRSTGRKDRHSKVCTAKGPRDRRVRLSAHTAIEFYDVQDRLGYDRPSKAVDWLIKKAKAAIDELEELPAWNPTADAIVNTSTAATNVQETEQQQQLAENGNYSSSFLPPSLNSDAIADTIKSFFPMGATTVSSPSIQLQSYPPALLSRTSSQNQDLRLSLQSFQEPILLQQHQHDHAQTEQQLFLSGTNHHHHFGIDGPSAGWSEHHQNHPAEISRFQQMVAWNTASACGATDTGSGGTSGNGGFIFNSILPQTVSPPPLFQPLFGQNNQFFSQRGPLQSSNTPSICARIDPTADHHHHHTQISQIHQQSFGGFSGFCVPARIQGEEEEHDGIHHKPSSASSDSRH